MCHIGFFKVDYGYGLRNLINKEKSLERIIDFDGYMVFKNASINTAIILVNDFKRLEIDYSRIKKPNLKEVEIIELLSDEEKKKKLS